MLCGGAVRPHDDLDLLVLNGDMPETMQLLEGLGFAHVHGSLEGGNVFYRRGELLLDLVPVLENPPRTLGELASIRWPADFLTEYFAQAAAHPDARHAPRDEAPCRCPLRSLPTTAWTCGRRTGWMRGRWRS
ncbi:hypothetical protein ACFOPQ_12970 [Deinococcus antarcticus]|uniref:Nucleotidyltransferase-like protein n=2 Tax=Deinococcus antarcticus TaxID=1298767 RepID=A0ABV8A7J1_9DEIO